MKSLIHKITIQQASEWFDSEDASCLLKWYEMPFKAKIINRFTTEFNELFNGKINLSDEAFKLILFNRAFNLLPALHEAIRCSLLSGNKNTLLKGMPMYKEEFGEDFLKIDDLARIKREIKRLRSKYEAYQGEPKEVEKFDFEKLVIAVEQIVGQHINRDLKLYQFKTYYEKAKKDGRNSTVSK